MLKEQKRKSNFILKQSDSFDRIYQIERKENLLKVTMYLQPHTSNEILEANLQTFINFTEKWEKIKS